jgi:hypothetical protein
MVTVLRFDLKKDEKVRNAELQEMFGDDVSVVFVEEGLRSEERVLELIDKHRADVVDARFFEYPDGFGNNFQAAITKLLKRLHIKMLHPLWCGGVFAGYKEWPFRN